MKVKARTPWLSIGGISFVVLLTLGNAAANMLPGHFPTARERIAAELAELAQARHAHIAALRADGDRCRTPVARELARALAFDGQDVAAYADDYARRCGEDPLVRRWVRPVRQPPAPRAGR